MSEASQLIKEFTTKDVKRLRALINNKPGEGLGDQIGYSVKEVERKEGEIWQEGGKQWTIKNGIKQTFTKLHNFKKLIQKPLVCPECKKKMSGKLDDKMYTIHNKCFDCVVKYESKLKIEGKYEEYEKGLLAANALKFIEEAREYIVDVSKESRDYYTADGTKENWSGPTHNQEAFNKMTEELNELETKIKEEYAD